MSIISGGVAYYNQKFVDVAENFDDFIQVRALSNPNVWRDRVPRGTFTLFEGLTKKSNIWRGGLGEQAGLANWSPIQISRVAAGNDQGHDACAYDPQTFNYAWDTISYSGYRSSWQSMPICLNDIKFVAEAKEQCRLQAAQCTYVTLTVWENWSREMYVKQAIDAGHAVILTEGGMEFLDDSTVRFTYDPFAVDADGDTTISFADTLKLSTLNWSYFDWLQAYLSDQCPEAALANDSGLPIFGLMIDMRDFERFVLSDDALREDYRYAQPEILVSDFRMGLKKFRGWALIHDPRQMRFKFDHITSNKAICKRVKPMRDGRAATIGNIPEANPNYVNAEIAVGVVFMNDVLLNQVPPTVGNMGSGMTFGSTPGYNGQFAWINEYDRTLNPLKDTGYFFARFEIFPKPLMYSTEAIVFAYRRCPQTWSTGCEIESSNDAVKTGAVAVVTAAVAADLDLTYNLVTLTLASILDARLGETVTLTQTGAGTVSAVIASDALAPTYTFAAESAIGAHTDYTTAATVTVA